MNEAVLDTVRHIHGEGERLLKEASLPSTHNYLLPGKLRGDIIELLSKVVVEGFTCDTIELESLIELEDWMEKPKEDEDV